MCTNFKGEALLRPWSHAGGTNSPGTLMLIDRAVMPASLQMASLRPASAGLRLPAQHAARPFTVHVPRLHLRRTFTCTARCDACCFRCLCVHIVTPGRAGFSVIWQPSCTIAYDTGLKHSKLDVVCLLLSIRLSPNKLFGAGLPAAPSRSTAKHSSMQSLALQQPLRSWLRCCCMLTLPRRPATPC